DVGRIKEKQKMLKGICPEAVDILKDKTITARALAVFRRVKPMRQIEIAELMVGLNNFSITYAQALVTATKAEDLVGSAGPGNMNGLKAHDLDRMRKEMESFEEDFKEVETSYEDNVMNLTLARGYLKRLLASGNVVRFLSSRYKEILDEFTKIVDSTPLDG
ncbi:MAG: chromosome partitioning protein ParB, partial [Candidatus Omnitrophica bacterium]|nr:chromosome partitioning protein ParB [Candidatus Omnitrophota bacterium]